MNSSGRNKISVVIPTLNESARIGVLLAELAQQPDLEVVVSDGGSTDRTGDVCQSYGVTFVAGPPGRGRQLNAGAETAGGEILLFLHADSSLESRILDDIRRAVSDGYHWGCCTFVFDECHLFFRVLAAICRWRVLFSSVCYGDQGIWCTRDLFEQAGNWPDLPLFEDRVFSNRLRRTGKAFVVPGRIATSTRRFREHGLWRMLWKSQALKVLFLLGVSPAKLFATYQECRGEPS